MAAEAGCCAILHSSLTHHTINLTIKPFAPSFVVVWERRNLYPSLPTTTRPQGVMPSQAYSSSSQHTQQKHADTQHSC